MHQVHFTPNDVLHLFQRHSTFIEHHVLPKLTRNKENAIKFMKQVLPLTTIYEPPSSIKQKIKKLTLRCIPSY